MKKSNEMVLAGLFQSIGIFVLTALALCNAESFGTMFICCVMGIGLIGSTLGLTCAYSELIDKTENKREGVAKDLYHGE